jgi:hypothetical protein
MTIAFEREAFLHPRPCGGREWTRQTGASFQLLQRLIQQGQGLSVWWLLGMRGGQALEGGGFGLGPLGLGRTWVAARGESMSIVPSAAEAVTEAGEGGLPPFVPPLWSFLSSPMPAKSAERAAVYPATSARRRTGRARCVSSTLGHSTCSARSRDLWGGDKGLDVRVAYVKVAVGFGLREACGGHGQRDRGMSASRLRLLASWLFFAQNLRFRQRTPHSTDFDRGPPPHTLYTGTFT